MVGTMPPRIQVPITIPMINMIRIAGADALMVSDIPSSISG